MGHAQMDGCTAPSASGATNVGVRKENNVPNRGVADPTRPRAMSVSIHEAKMLREALDALDRTKDQAWRDYWRETEHKLRHRLETIITAMGE